LILIVAGMNAAHNSLHALVNTVYIRDVHCNKICQNTHCHAGSKKQRLRLHTYSDARLWCFICAPRLTFFNNRALAVQRKTHLLLARAWRAAEAGWLRQLPVAGCGWRLSWSQNSQRGLTSEHCK
jgi:hypothetical protein